MIKELIVTYFGIQLIELLIWISIFVISIIFISFIDKLVKKEKSKERTK